MTGGYERREARLQGGRAKPMVDRYTPPSHRWIVSPGCNQAGRLAEWSSGTSTHTSGKPHASSCGSSSANVFARRQRRGARSLSSSRANLGSSGSRSIARW